MRYLIFLHPMNHTPNIITPFRRLIELLGFKLIAPNSPLNRKWYEIMEREPQVIDNKLLLKEDKHNILKSRDLIENILDELVEDEKINPRDIYLTGFSQGGCIASLVGYTSKYELGKVISICSYVPLITDIEEEEKFHKERTNIQMINGTKDEVINPKFIELMKSYYPYIKVEWCDCDHKPNLKLFLSLLDKFI